jgi:hypothetical protein
LLLKRLFTSAAHEQEMFDWHADMDDENRVCVDFKEFGRGPDNFSYFRASLNWADVEKIIAAFSASNHPNAVRIAKAVRLADAVEDLIRNSN